MDMRFSFGYGFVPSKLDEFHAVARAAEKAGFSMVGTGDTAALKGEVFVGLSQIAQQTTDCRVASMVINAPVWHPVMMASGFATIDAMSGGRALMTLATGDTGVYNLGMKPASMKYIEEYIHAIRELWDKGEAEWQGTTIRFAQKCRRIPIFMAPGGPKGLNIAGRIADGVLVETGVLPEVIEDTMRRLREGAEEAGRSIDDIEVWWHLRPSFGESKEAAISEIETFILGIGNRLARFSNEGKNIPDHIWPKLVELRENYDFLRHHEDADRDRSERKNASMLNNLGLREYLSDRFAIAGTSEDWVERLKQLYDLGVRNIAMLGMSRDPVAFVEKFGREVFPHVSSKRA